MTSEDAALIAGAIDRLTEILNLIFRLPPTEQLTALFSAGFVTPMIVYLVANAIGKLVNFWR